MPKEDRRQAVSFLVRLWLEPQGVDKNDDAIRGFVRDLATGQEKWLADPDQIARALVEQFHTQTGMEADLEKERASAG